MPFQQFQYEETDLCSGYHWALHVDGAETQIELWTGTAWAEPVGDDQRLVRGWIWDADTNQWFAAESAEWQIPVPDLVMRQFHAILLVHGFPPEWVGG